MQKKGANISLKGYDDIFSTDQSRAEAQQERVQEIPLSELNSHARLACYTMNKTGVASGSFS